MIMVKMKLNLFFSFFLLLLQLSELHGQICEGNLGENIFTEGDFGSGADNILQTNPQIAPGYGYTTSPPPADGQYLISNFTGGWLAAFPTWLEIGDNSSDPDGYMMVVNASYAPGLFYEQEVEGLCENTLYEFSADVINLIQQSVGGHIKPNVSFLINGVQVYTTGEIAQDEQWNTYGFTFTTDPGQTSVTLSLRNNAPGGIGNDLALDNITFRPCGPEALILPTEIANICEDGDPIELEATIIGDQYQNPAFQWQQSFDEGVTWEDIPGENASTFVHTNLVGGFYYYRYLLASAPANLDNSKCRIVSNVKIIHVIPKFYTIVDTLCEGLTFNVGNSSYSSTGIFVDSMISSIGCDSIVTLDLTIVPDAGIDADFLVNDPSCHGFEDGSIELDTVFNGVEPYFFRFENQAFNDQVISGLGAGNYLFSIADRYGCSFTEEIILSDPAPFIIELGPDLEVELGDPVLIQPTSSHPVESFNWQPVSMINCETDCWNLEWIPTNSMNLFLTAVSVENCPASDSTSIEVIKNRKVFIPNSFSPNGDGTNDFFAIYGAISNVQRIEKMIIFDRWGGVVFENHDFAPNDQLNGWDGTTNGKSLDKGIYVYLVDIRFLDNEIVRFSGDIALIK